MHKNVRTRFAQNNISRKYFASQLEEICDKRNRTAEKATLANRMSEISPNNNRKLTQNTQKITHKLISWSYVSVGDCSKKASLDDVEH